MYVKKKERNKLLLEKKEKSFENLKNSEKKIKRIVSFVKEYSF
jgi:hypothetical protein